MSKLIHISRSKYRVLVSDVLPYERPLFFTNRFFSRFLKFHGVVCKDGKLIATINHTEGLEEMLSIIGGQPDDKRKAFQYDISKDGHEDRRRLTIIHPYHQVQMVEFYERYKTVLIDFCSRSHFSLRYPYKMATRQNRSKGFLRYISDEIKHYHAEESIKHFFVYRPYNNINEFYDDNRFLDAEKKFLRMYKSDLEHCFDAIKPELLSIAMFDEDLSYCQGSMAEEFFLLNQSYLSREDGIVIGPEFSRLYAEIILQRVDSDTESELKKLGYCHNKEYTFYRYVDDGFLFCNEEETMTVFYNVYDACLKKYGLKRKESEDKAKTHTYEHRPFIENITIGKLKFKELVDTYLENRLDTFKGYKNIQSGYYEIPTVLDYKSFIHSVRSIMGAYDLKYKDIMSYLLGRIRERLDDLLCEFNDLYKQYSFAEITFDINDYGWEIKRRYEREFSLFLDSLIDVLFFLYQCDPRMNTSVKTMELISRLQNFVRGKYKFEDGTWSQKFPLNTLRSLDEKITNLTQQLYMDMPNDPMIFMGHLNMLDLQKCMSSATQLHPNVLIERFANNKDWTFFTIFELMHYIKNDSRYQPLLDVLNSQIKERIERLAHKGESDTEAVLTFIEALCCPWINDDVKMKYLDVFKNVDKDKVLKFAHKQKELFVRWRNYDVLEEVQHMNSTEVY